MNLSPTSTADRAKCASPPPNRRSPIHMFTAEGGDVPVPGASTTNAGTAHPSSSSGRISVEQLCHAAPTPSSGRDDGRHLAAADRPYDHHHNNRTGPTGSPVQEPVDDDVHLAAQALGQLGAMSPIAGNSIDFMSRVTSYPLVNTALRMYQSSKASSRVMKYGAETMESSVKTLCRPVLNRLETNLVGLDDFACKQLDKIERHCKLSEGAPAWAVSSAVAPSVDCRLRKRTQQRRVLEEYDTGVPAPPTTTEALVATIPAVTTAETSAADASARTWWKQVLVGAGTGAVVFSEESMRRIKYCLDWLQYAAGHIQSQITTLREVIQSLQETVLGGGDGYGQPGEPAEAGVVGRRTIHPIVARLAKTKREVVQIMKKVISIISQYAGSALPAEARRHVRNLIMGLPSRWAAIDPRSSAPGSRSGTASPAALSSPLLSPAAVQARANPLVHSEANARKVLNFATESQLMLDNVSGVFQEIMGGAEGWRRTFRGLGFNVNTSVSADGDIMMAGIEGHGGVDARSTSSTPVSSSLYPTTPTTLSAAYKSSVPSPNLTLANIAEDRASGESSPKRNRVAGWTGEPSPVQSAWSDPMTTTDLRHTYAPTSTAGDMSTDT
ncbi:transcriptional regulator opi1 [Tieghemiomyces parasiticus]|uniref:Transcriptional regulator opi1 n=1 Tax=Tieghemiomyces parasiticus TaxID=78921 RepID=A0A9W7ZVT0_9FUNG|nr:transcriptional regulator opi1 [Tieghemiomyces parasiticus]